MNLAVLLPSRDDLDRNPASPPDALGFRLCHVDDLSGSEEPRGARSLHVQRTLHRAVPLPSSGTKWTEASIAGLLPTSMAWPAFVDLTQFNKRGSPQYLARILLRRPQRRRAKRRQAPARGESLDRMPGSSSGVVVHRVQIRLFPGGFGSKKALSFGNLPNGLPYRTLRPWACLVSSADARRNLFHRMKDGHSSF